jgi:hypothetical protein
VVDDDGLDLVRDIVKPIHVRERRLFRRSMVFLITGWSSALVAGRLEHADGLLRARATGAILGRKWLLSAARCAPGGRGQPSLSLKKPPLTDDSGTLK